MTLVQLLVGSSRSFLGVFHTSHSQEESSPPLLYLSHVRPCGLASAETLSLPPPHLSGTKALFTAHTHSFFSLTHTLAGIKVCLVSRWIRLSDRFPAERLTASLMMKLFAVVQHSSSVHQDPSNNEPRNSVVSVRKVKKVLQS